MGYKWEEEALDFIQKKTYMNADKIGAAFPHVSKNKKYDSENPIWWTAGFWPGILWNVYLADKEKNKYLALVAEECEKKMDYLLTDIDKLDHDMGFMWTLTSVADYKITKNKESRRRALLAASLLSSRFNAKGNYIRAWNSHTEKDENAGVAIIDCMMNLALLYFASEETRDPRFKHIAEKHADMVLENFIREDGSVQHIVVFDPETGAVVEKRGGQGFAPDSAWARGCAWAVYGFAISYHHTKNINYLNAAKKTAHYFLSNMQDKVCPVWDFRVPKDGDIKYSYPDSSAAAIAACGLLLLGDEVSDFESSLYKNAGTNILKNLYLNASSKDDDDEEGLIYHATGHFPEQQNLDVPIIYGDYFFAEGIARLNNNNILFW